MQVSLQHIASQHLVNNLFLALIPEGQAGPEVNRIANQSRAEYGLTGMPLGLQRYHVTLHSLGAMPHVSSDLVAATTESFAPMAARTEPFEMHVNRALSFEIKRPKSPFVLSNSKINWPLLDLYRRLGKHLGRNRTTFTPHITLLYDAKRIPEHTVAPISWAVTELVLVRSYVGQGRHEHLAHWPLKGSR
jgi:2'-5' RNA ligase